MTLLVANWKMFGANGLSVKLLSAIAEHDTSGVYVGIMLPFPYLYLGHKLLANTNISWGSQTLHHCDHGAYTGAVAAPMLAEFGCQYAIVGHSERRNYYGETDLIVAEQAKAAIQHNITPIICVGESFTVREQGDYLAYIANQVKTIVNAIGDVLIGHKFIIAYEPIWAIGSGNPAQAEQIAEVNIVIRQSLLQVSLEFSENCIIIYGGSVDDSNLAALLQVNDVSGALVGGASLKSDVFLKMVDICKV